MKLTPLDIRKQEFTRTFRGFEIQEVTAFLQLVANEWEGIMTEQNRLESKVAELEVKLRHYEQVEVALQQALNTARESAEQMIEGAKNKAEGLIHEAEGVGARIKREAEEERRRMRDDVMHLKSRRDQILARLRAFLAAERELLDQYEREEAIRFGGGKMERTPSSQGPTFYQPKVAQHFEKSGPRPALQGGVMEELSEEEARPAWKQNQIVQAEAKAEAEASENIPEEQDQEGEVDRIRRVLRNLE